MNLAIGKIVDFISKDWPFAIDHEWSSKWLHWFSILHHFRFCALRAGSPLLGLGAGEGKCTKPKVVQYNKKEIPTHCPSIASTFYFPTKYIKAFKKGQQKRASPCFHLFKIKPISLLLSSKRRPNI
ncbi:MAG TPA: hypothetical protein ENJ95_11270 [Bacteroidetes bacterium]|nr:hypothetical protein [Bacteroidota bacterium]